MNQRMIQAFKIAASRTIESLENTPLQIKQEAIQKLTHQFMLNEFGFNYLLEMEFNDDIFVIFQEFQQYPKKLLAGL